MKQNKYVTASEIGDFVYCPRGWWLKLQGFFKEPNDAMITGTKKHDSLAENVNLHATITTISIILIISAIIVLVVLFAYGLIMGAK